MTLQRRKSRCSRLSRKPRRKRGSAAQGTRHAHEPREVALAEAKDDVSKYLRLAVEEEIVMTRLTRSLPRCYVLRSSAARFTAAMMSGYAAQRHRFPDR
jgi:hypothetical protein